MREKNRPSGSVGKRVKTGTEIYGFLSFIGTIIFLGTRYIEITLKTSKSAE